MSQSSSPKPHARLWSTLQTVANYFKPHRAEALQRIRINAFCFFVIVVVSNLLPLPSLQIAIWDVTSTSHHARWSSDWVYKWICMSEVAITGIIIFNILEGVYAVKYPRPPLPPISSPAKTKSIYTASPTSQRSFKILSPNTSPQPQRPFSSSPSRSFSASASAAYPTSPLSTPSRVLQYPSISSTNTQASSTSTMGFPPSPIISAYRGKHASAGVGRAFDGSFLGRLAAEESDGDD